jgi:hypothetical protein
MKFVISNDLPPLTQAEALKVAEATGLAGLGIVTLVRLLTYSEIDPSTLGISASKFSSALSSLSKVGFLSVYTDEGMVRVESRDINVDELTVAIRPGKRPTSISNAVELWDDLYQNKMRTKYTWQIVDHSVLKHLIHTRDERIVMRGMVSFFKLSEDQVQPYGYTIRNFATRIDQLLSAANPVPVVGIPEELMYGE